MLEKLFIISLILIILALGISAQHFLSENRRLKELFEDAYQIKAFHLQSCKIDLGGKYENFSNPSDKMFTQTQKLINYQLNGL